ncbi:MAG TPA: hypothetical protein VF384_04075 [Planctomycetota bacterium]
MTFRDTAVAKELKARFVESRLHMDGQDVVPRAKFEKHVVLQDELIGNPAMPFYAILDPTTDEFLFRANLRGGDQDVWKKDFLAMFAKLPPL